MGITLHYNGVLRRDAVLSELINIASTEALRNPGWSTFVFRDHFEDTEPGDIAIFGMVINAPHCETLYLTFDRERNLSMYLLDQLEEQEPERNSHGKKQRILKGAFTKTAFAGAEVHMKMVDLLRSVSEKFFEHFEMIDEAGYWENRNASELRRVFGDDNPLSDLMEKKLRSL